MKENNSAYYFESVKNKRVRVRKKPKKEKPVKIKKPKEKKQISTYSKKKDPRIKTQQKKSSIGFRFLRIKKKNRKKDSEEKQSTNETLEVKKTNKNLLSFDHEITDFEYKLRYLNLRDLEGNEFGSVFPPLKSNLIILDDDGARFIIIKAGANQISGDLLAYYKKINIKPGDIVTVEYDRDETVEGRRVIRIKSKKE